MQNYTIGIDEAGRGPLAGPVAVGVALVPADFDWGLLPGVTDSKQLTAGKREEIFVAARRLKAAGRLDYAVSMVSARVIDQIGIVPAINLAVQKSLKKIENNHPSSSPGLELAEECAVKLDGGLKAPERYVQQETIIKGDAMEPVIGLASIVAKVTRDRYMIRLSQRDDLGYQLYDFATHKGYGTVNHRAAIAKHGLSDQHRRSFCRFYNKN